MVSRIAALNRHWEKRYKAWRYRNSGTIAKGTAGEATVSPSLPDRLRQGPTAEKPESRRELGRNKSKSLFLLVGVCVAVLLVFFGVFSHPKQKIALNPRGEASPKHPRLAHHICALCTIDPSAGDGTALLEIIKDTDHLSARIEGGAFKRSLSGSLTESQEQQDSRGATT